MSRSERTMINFLYGLQGKTWFDTNAPAILNAEAMADVFEERGIGARSGSRAAAQQPADGTTILPIPKRGLPAKAYKGNTSQVSRLAQALAPEPTLDHLVEFTGLFNQLASHIQRGATWYLPFVWEHIAWLDKWVREGVIAQHPEAVVPAVDAFMTTISLFAADFKQASSGWVEEHPDIVDAYNAAKQQQAVQQRGVEDGAALLNDIEAFLARFVAYPNAAARVAHTLWIAHAWFMDCWEATPRLAFLSTEPGSGKSRCLEVTEPLVPNPIHAVNVTPTYIFRKISDKDGLPTILFDEVDTVFNSKGGGNETLRGVLNAGYRRGATAGRVLGTSVEELPAYCAVALAGLGNLPDTIMTRSVIVRMRRRPEGADVESWRPRTVAPEASALYSRLQYWAATNKANVTWPALPEGIADRNADVWEPLISVADLAGGNWPMRARAAALYLIAGAD